MPRSVSDFTGFRSDHFQYFLLHDDDDARRWIREQMEYFAKKVLPSVQALRPFYEHYTVGTLRKTDLECWVAFGPMGPRPKEYRYWTHQTTNLASDGLHVFINAELQEATDRVKHVLGQSPAAFRRALQELHAFEPFELVLGQRVQRQGMLFDYTPKMRLHSSLLAENTGDVAWKAFAQTVDLVHLPYLNVDRLVRPPALADPVRAVQRVVEILQRNDAVVQLLNAPGGQ